MRQKMKMLFAPLLAILLAACPAPADPPPDLPATGVIVIKMHSIPSGTFKRGPDLDDTSHVTGFQMSETEITVKQFTAITGLANPSTDFTEVPDGPVQCVNWYHTLVFCNKLSMLEDLVPVYSIKGSTDPADWGDIPLGDSDSVAIAAWDAVAADWSASGFRLPTDMEWWWAAMGGIDAPLSMFAGWDGANAAGDFAWFFDNSGHTTHTAGTRAPNALGLYDMSGNVMEWCWDWYAPVYPSGPLSEYRGPSATDDRVRKGGGFQTGSGSFLSPAARDQSQDWDHQYSWNKDLGFRIVRK